MSSLENGQAPAGVGQFVYTVKTMPQSAPGAPEGIIGWRSPRAQQDDRVGHLGRERRLTVRLSETSRGVHDTALCAAKH